MRLQLSKIVQPDEYLLHADMFNTNKFKTSGIVINTGLGESNLLNIAGGLASQGKTVYIYGVAGFIIHRLEQLKFSCKLFGGKVGKIIICNAGKIGYDKLGAGHELNDDIDIMNILSIPTYIPETLEHFDLCIQNIKEKDTGVYYIQLGKDFEDR